LRETPKSDPLDAGLQHVLDAWPTLPEALRSGILAMVDAAQRLEK
jgi:hypothetical protein